MALYLPIFVKCAKQILHKTSLHQQHFVKMTRSAFYIYKNGKITEILQNGSINAPIIITFALLQVLMNGFQITFDILALHLRE